jgi:type IV pilus biogenesis protein CpaD/CtpE
MAKLRATAMLLVFAAAGCAQTDPYVREGLWRPNDANAANLRAMVVVPSDVVAATQAGPADGSLAAAAVDRLRRGHVRPLPESGIAQIVVVGGAPATPLAAAPQAGAGD